MSTQTHVQTQLEGSVKATVRHLSRILAYQARLRQHGVAQYAPVAAPRQLSQALEGEVAHFSAICDQLEQRVRRAIAVLERDARKAAGVSPLPTSPSLAAPAVAVQTKAEDDALLPFAMPLVSASATPAQGTSRSATMQLDLTLSPSPPPTTGDASLPSQMPPSTTATGTSAGWATGDAPAAMLDLTGDDPDPAPRNSGTDSAANDDINALLASLNMPPFDASVSPTFSVPPPPAPAAVSSAPGAFPDLSLDALNALLTGSTSTSTAPPASAPTTGAVPPTLDSLGLTLGPTSSSSSSQAAPTAPDFSMLDLSALGDTSSGFGTLGEVDFTSFAAAPSTGGGGAGDASLDELLRSLGGRNID